MSLKICFINISTLTNNLLILGSKSAKKSKEEKKYESSEEESEEEIDTKIKKKDRVRNHRKDNSDSDSKQIAIPQVLCSFIYSLTIFDCIPFVSARINLNRNSKRT